MMESILNQWKAVLDPDNPIILSSIVIPPSNGPRYVVPILKTTADTPLDHNSLLYTSFYSKSASLVTLAIIFSSNLIIL